MSKPIQGRSIAFVCTALLAGTACPGLAQPSQPAGQAMTKVTTQDMEDPANIDWSQALYVSVASGVNVLVHNTENSAYMIAAQGQGKPKADAQAFEVAWAHGKSENDLKIILHQGMGYPIAAAQWEGNTSRQEFYGGTVTWDKTPVDSKGELASPETKLNLDGAKAAAKHYNTGYEIRSFKGDFTKISETTYVSEEEHLFLLFDTRSGRIGAVTPRVYEEYRQNPNLFGAITGYHDTGNTGRYGIQHQISYFQRDNGEEVEVQGIGQNSIQYDVSKDGKLIYSDYINREPEWEPRDPASVDWSRATHVQSPGMPDDKGGALYVQDGDSLIVIKATEDGKPAPGARAYHSPWLGRMASQWDPVGFGQFARWSQEITGKIEKEALLGVPVAEARTVVQQGAVYLVQRFENGSARWKLPVNPFTGDADPFAGKYTFNARAIEDAVITLSPQAQEVYDTWKKENDQE